MATDAQPAGAPPDYSSTKRASILRLVPSLFQHDYLVLRLLHRDVARGIAMLPGKAIGERVAVDVGAGGAPYRPMLQDAGYAVRCLDIAPGPGVDVVGTAESTGLPDASVDLVLCTQVLEHTRAPWLAMREFRRIVRPGGGIVFSVPHIWFFHPHPHDYWRMTSEGLQALCDEGGFRSIAVLPQGGAGAALFQIVGFLAYGVLGRVGAPLYALLNTLGLLVDAVVFDRRFSLNHVAVAVLPPDEAVHRK